MALGVTLALKTHFSKSPDLETGNTKSSGERLELGEWGGAGFTDCCSLVMGCQEDGCEAEEGSQAGGISAAAFAIPVKDVDLGWLKVEAGIDLNHRAGPAGGGREAGVGRVQGCPAGTWGKVESQMEWGL